MACSRSHEESVHGRAGNWGQMSKIQPSWSKKVFSCSSVALMRTRGQDHSSGHHMGPVKVPQFGRIVGYELVLWDIFWDAGMDRERGN